MAAGVGVENGNSMRMLSPNAFTSAGMTGSAFAGGCAAAAAAAAGSDGGEGVAAIAGAGADIMVAGASIFGSGDYEQTIGKMKTLLGNP